MIVIDDVRDHNLAELLDTGVLATRVCHFVSGDVDQAGLDIFPERFGTETTNVVGSDTVIEFEVADRLGAHQCKWYIVSQFVRVSDPIVDAL